MTNEKAIYFLDKRKKELLEKQDSKEGFEFIKALAEIRSLEMAIKALKAQPQPIVMTEEEFERYLANEDLVVVKRKLLNEALESQLMRDATEEERKSVKDYIESISKPTGLQFEAQPCEDCISRQAVIILIDEASEMHPYKVVGDSDTYSNYNQGWSDACDWLYANIEGVPSVIPQIQPNSNEFFNFDAPMVKKSDAVSREAVIKNIKGWFDKIELNPDILIDSIVTLPSVTPSYNSIKTELKPCEDCVNRSELQKTMDSLPLFRFVNNDHEEADDYYNCESVDMVIRNLPSVTPRRDLAETSQDCISRQAVIRLVEQYPNIIGNRCSGLISDIKHLPSVIPQYTDEEIDKAQAVEQAYVDKMVELAVEESRKKWLNSFDTSSATKCFEAVNLLKERLKNE